MRVPLKLEVLKVHACSYLALCIFSFWSGQLVCMEELTVNAQHHYMNTWHPTSHDNHKAAVYPFELKYVLKLHPSLHVFVVQVWILRGLNQGGQGAPRCKKHALGMGCQQVQRGFWWCWSCQAGQSTYHCLTDIQQTLIYLIEHLMAVLTSQVASAMLKTLASAPVAVPSLEYFCHLYFHAFDFGIFINF